MRIAFLIVLVLAVCTALPLRHSKSPKKMIEELQSTKTGSTLLHMMQLHSMAQGPVQELIEAIEELINDLNEELVELEAEFTRRTAEHNSLVVTYEQDIQDAYTDVQRTEDVIQNLLRPRRAQLQQKIAQVQEYQAENRKNLQEDTLLREQDHQSYEAQVEELNAATAAVDEALALLSSLSNPSLAQVNQLQTSLKKIQKSFKSKNKNAPMIKALIQLALNQNFSDQGIIGQIVGALNEFRNEVVNSLNELTAQEAQNVADFEARVDQLQAEYAEFQRQINTINVDLTAVSEKLEEMSRFGNQRDQDRRTFQEQLDLENTQYAQETEIYTDLKNEYLREIAVSEQALSVVQSGDFSNIGV